METRRDHCDLLQTSVPAKERAGRGREGLRFGNPMNYQSAKMRNGGGETNRCQVHEDCTRRAA